MAITQCPTRRARGLTPSRTVSGPGSTRRDDDAWSDRPSVNPLYEGGPRTVDVDNAGGGTLQARRPTGSLERVYRRDDQRFRAGEKYRSLLEAVQGGSRSMIVNILDGERLGAPIDCRASLTGEISEHRLEQLQELAQANALIGDIARQVLTAWLGEGRSFAQIDKAMKRNRRGKDATVAGVYASDALNLLVDELGW